MAFQFNFKVGETQTSTADQPDAAQSANLHQAEHEQLISDSEVDYDSLQPAEEVRPTTAQLSVKELNETMEEVEIAPGLKLWKGRVSNTQAAELLDNQEVSHSDLVPNVYEGGFKLWEGAVDLCHYMMQQYKLDAKALMTAKSLDTPLRGKRVLELGCGHGLPGILALLAGAEVHFQDYNREVLQLLTIPNVMANISCLPPGRPRPEARYIAGDWHCVGEYLSSQGLGGYYDIILTSESIYNIDSHSRLLECLKQVLQPPLGIALVAAKSFYFGVGGGIKTFKQAVARDKLFEVTQVYRTSTDVMSQLRRHTIVAGQIEDAEQEVKGGSSNSNNQQQTSEVNTSVRNESGSTAQSVISTSASEQQRQGVAGNSGDAGFKQAAATGKGASTDVGGNVREILKLSFPSAILPYFL